MMTNEEAVKILTQEIDTIFYCIPSYDDLHDKNIVDRIEAHKLAIKVLKQEPKIRHCKDCKYFEYDSMTKVDGIPLIVAHEICSKWGDGCKTKEDGYCFLFEPQESNPE